jgi:hypothetical protein
MAHYRATIDSRRGAAETFGYLARFSNAAEWDPPSWRASSWTLARSGSAPGSASWCRSWAGACR